MAIILIRDHFNTSPFKSTSNTTGFIFQEKSPPVNSEPLGWELSGKQQRRRKAILGVGTRREEGRRRGAGRGRAGKASSSGCHGNRVQATRPEAAWAARGGSRPPGAANPAGPRAGPGGRRALIGRRSPRRGPVAGRPAQPAPAATAPSRACEDMGSRGAPAPREGECRARGPRSGTLRSLSAEAPWDCRWPWGSRRRDRLGGQRELRVVLVTCC